MDQFGTEVTTVGIAVRGVITAEQAGEFAIACVEAIGMKVSHPATLVQYLPHNGEDIGFLLLQPLIESYVILDVWPNLDGFYLGVVSCKDFSMVDIEVLIAKWGFKI